MKKLLTLLALSGILFFIGQKEALAQTEGYELGLRGGFANGVAFAMPLGANRLHASVGFGTNLSIDALYDWQRPLGDGGFFFYPGIGVSVAFGTEFELGVAGEAGIEYQFEFPLSLAADFRPIYEFTGSTGFKSGWGIEARWRF
jgi:hypothetical protein